MDRPDVYEMRSFVYNSSRLYRGKETVTTTSNRQPDGKQILAIFTRWFSFFLFRTTSLSLSTEPQTFLQSFSFNCRSCELRDIRFAVSFGRREWQRIYRFNFPAIRYMRPIYCVSAIWRMLNVWYDFNKIERNTEACAIYFSIKLKIQREDSLSVRQAQAIVTSPYISFYVAKKKKNCRK